MNDLQHEQIRDKLAGHLSQLGTATKLDDRYFRFRKPLGKQKKLQTTAAVYLRGVGSNLLEIAFEPDAVSKCIGRPNAALVEWISQMQETIGRNVHSNARFNFLRIGIGDYSDLDKLISAWEQFVNTMEAQKPPLQCGEEFIRIPYYLESDGTKTFFLPHLKRPNGFQIGEKGREIYVEDYWLALKELQNMSVARFRRPNRNNNLGIVACASSNWEEVKRSYVNDQINNVGIGDLND